MTDAPERIWLNQEPDGLDCFWYGELPEEPSPEQDIEYIRKDIADAAVAAERERCANKAENYRAHINFNALLGVMRDKPLDPKVVNAVSDLFDGLAAAIREGE